MWTILHITSEDLLKVRIFFCSELGRYLDFQNFNLSVIIYALVLHIVPWFDVFRQVISVYDI